MNEQELFVGIDLGGTNIKGGLVSKNGEIVVKKKIPTEVDGGVNHVLNRIKQLVHELTESINNNIPIRHMGIGMAGQVDAKRGVFLEGPNLPGWHGVNAVKELTKLLNISVAVDNDANLAALAEFTYGAGKGARDMLMVTLGTGVGGGLILGGKIYHGAGGLAGEFGHITIQQDGPVCKCGRRGCVEAFVGTYAIIRQVREKIDAGQESLLKKIDPGKMTPKDVSIAAAQGDKVALEVLRDVGTYLGIGLANVVNLLNIERVVVGGGVANAGKFILEPARESLNKSALTNLAKMVTVVPSVLGEQAGIVGAAMLAVLEKSSE